MPETISGYSLASRIREERKARKLSLRELGEVFNVPHQTISQAENASRQGIKIDELRVQILSYLLNRKIAGPEWTILDEKLDTAHTPSIWALASDSFDSLASEDLEKLPKDGAANHDHFIYNTEKENL